MPVVQSRPIVAAFVHRPSIESRARNTCVECVFEFLDALIRTAMRLPPQAVPAGESAAAGAETGVSGSTAKAITRCRNTPRTAVAAPPVNAARSEQAAGDTLKDTDGTCASEPIPDNERGQNVEDPDEDTSSG